MGALHCKDENGSFSVEFDRCMREPLSWKEELHAAARAIASKTSKPLWLCSSGGIDSEIMCQAFFDQGINFSVLTLEHIGGTNQHDIGYARTWCKKHDVHQRIEPIDMYDFFQVQIPAYLQQGYASHHMLRYLQIKMMEIVESLGGFAVMAAGKQYYRIDAEREDLTRNDVFLEFASGHVAPLEWCVQNNVSHEPYFMYGTPELCLSYLRIPLIDFVLDHPDILRHPASTFILKRLVFQQYWPLHAPRPKFHGFEKIKADVTPIKQRIKKEFPEHVQSYRLSVPEFSGQLDPERASRPH